VTRLLVDLCTGKPEAGEKLFPLVYDELYELARRFMARQRPDHTLQATALVNEAFIRLGGKREQEWESRVHFLRIAARAMRAILIDHDRRRRAEKRGDGWRRKPLLDEQAITSGGEPLDYTALDRALRKLAEIDPRSEQVVELRFFGGLTVEETSEVLGVSPRTVKQDWRAAKAWLAHELKSGE
jgi:RNA polymerase sigma factor (TIGR02999 family)